MRSPRAYRQYIICHVYRTGAVKNFRSIAVRSIRPSVRPIVPHYVRYISLILFEVGSQIWCVDASWDGGVSRSILGSSDLVYRIIVSGQESHLVCGRILEAYHLRVTVTLISDLVSRIIVSRPYLLYYLRQEYQIWDMDASLDGGVSLTISGSL